MSKPDYESNVPYNSMEAHKHVNGDLVMAAPVSLAQMAKDIKSGDKEIEFHARDLPFNAEAIISLKPMDMYAELTPTAISVTNKIDQMLGDLASSVKLKVGLVDTTESYTMGRTPDKPLKNKAYPAGLFVSNNIAQETKQRVLDKLNAYLTKDDAVQLSSDGEIHVSVEQLNTIAQKLERQERIANRTEAHLAR